MQLVELVDRGAKGSAAGGEAKCRNLDMSGKFAFLNFIESYRGGWLPTMRDSGLPKVPPRGVFGIEDLPNPKAITSIPSYVQSAVSPSVYASTRPNTRRNLYRIQLP